MSLLNIAILVIAITQSLSISIGIGAATLAVVNFFLTTSDGVIDTVERRMMKAVYVVIQVAMVLLVIATGTLTAVQYSSFGPAYFIPFVIMLWVLIAVLFVNAFLLFMKVMPASIGPALQAATWYSLGLMLTLLSLGLYSFTLKQFIAGYIGVIVLAIVVVNGLMMLQEQRAKRRANSMPTPQLTTTTPAVTVSDHESSHAVSTTATDADKKD